MKKILIFLYLIVVNTMVFSQTFNITEYKNSNQSKFVKSSGQLISDKTEIKIFDSNKKLIMNFKISNLDDFTYSDRIICDGVDAILKEYLIIEIRYDKTYDTFIWTMFYEDGYAIFKTKKYEQTFNLHFPR